MHHLFSYAQSRVEQREKMMFYNVENLFDTKDDPLTHDEEFTYNGWKRWSYSRYITKQRNISSVVEKLGDGNLPMFVGFCELENRSILIDMLESTKLAASPYKIVHYDSPDRRGIDVGLLYDTTKLFLMTSRALELRFSRDDNIKTRDILYSKFRYKTDTTLSIYVRWRKK